MWKYFLPEYSNKERIIWAVVLAVMLLLSVYTLFVSGATSYTDSLSVSKPETNKMSVFAPPNTTIQQALKSRKQKEKFSLKKVLGLGKEDYTKIPVYFPVRHLGFKRVSSQYGMRNHPIKKKRKFHSGLDLAAKRGTPIYASADGKVILDGHSPSYGIYVLVQHPNSYATMYGHMQKKVVKEGDIVEQGEVIGHVGSTGRSTGPHLHFEIFKNGKNIDPFKFWMNRMDDYYK